MVMAQSTALLEFLQGKMVETGKRPDCRYLTVGKEELCYLWNRGDRGCSEPCSHARRHLCERCLGQHRAVDDSCPAPLRPEGWRPAPAAPKGKSKGKPR